MKGSREAKEWGETMRKRKIQGKGGGGPSGTMRTQEFENIFNRATLEILQHDINEDNSEQIFNGTLPFIVGTMVSYFLGPDARQSEVNELFRLLGRYRQHETSENYWHVRREFIKQLNRRFFADARRGSIPLPNPDHQEEPDVVATPVDNNLYFPTTVTPILVDERVGRVTPAEAVAIRSHQNTMQTAQNINNVQTHQQNVPRVRTNHYPILTEIPLSIPTTSVDATNGFGILFPNKLHENRELGIDRRKSRFVKGSIEAKEHMAKLRSMRKK